MANGRCWMHGGKASGAPIGNRNAWKNGMYSAAHYEWLDALNKLLGMAKPEHGLTD
jgi:uncharacterized protein YjcR